MAPITLNPNEEAFLPGLFSSLDKDGNGLLPGPACVDFFQKSKLNVDTLAQIWALADSNERGFLDRNDFFVAMRLIGLAQNGRPLSRDAATSGQNVILPVFEGISPPAAGLNFSQEDIDRYTVQFRNYQLVNGKLDGNRARGILLESGLPNEVLRDIWNLSDADADGALSIGEFVVAMVLVNSVRQGRLSSVPATLPPALAAASSRLLAASNSGFSFASPTIPSPDPTWAITPAELAKYYPMFEVADVQKRGFVAGSDVRDFLAQTNLPTSVLIHIWNLADIKQSGALTRDEFVVCMKLVYMALAGEQLPATLPPSLIPPALRTGQPNPLAALNTPAVPTPAVYKPADPIISSGDPDLDDARAKLQAERVALAEVQQQITIFQSDISDIKTKRQAAEQQLNAQASEKEELERRIKNLKQSLENDLRTDKDIKSLIELQKQENASLSVELDQAEAKMHAVEQEKQRSQEKALRDQQEYQKLSMQLTETQRKLAKMREDIAAVVAERERVQQQTDRLKPSLDEATLQLQALTSSSSSTATALAPLQPTVPSTDFDAEFASFTPPPAKQDPFFSPLQSTASPLSNVVSNQSDPFPFGDPFQSANFDAPQASSTYAVPPFLSNPPKRFSINFDNAFGDSATTSSPPPAVAPAPFETSFDSAFGFSGSFDAGFDSTSVNTPPVVPYSSGFDSAFGGTPTSSVPISSGFDDAFGDSAPRTPPVLPTRPRPTSTAARSSSASPTMSASLNSDDKVGTAKRSSSASNSSDRIIIGKAKSTSGSVTSAPTELPSYDDVVSTNDPLVRMHELGLMDDSVNRAALKKFNNNIEQAVNHILNSRP